LISSFFSVFCFIYSDIIFLLFLIIELTFSFLFLLFIFFLVFLFTIDFLFARCVSLVAGRSARRSLRRGERSSLERVALVAAALGVGPDTPIDTGNGQTLTALMTAIITHENGTQPYDGGSIAAGAAAAIVA